MRAHQSDFAALLHKTLCFAVPPNHVTRHVCFDDPTIGAAAEDVTQEVTSEGVEAILKSKSAKPALVATAMLSEGSGAVSLLCVPSCQGQHRIKVARRLAAIGAIDLWAHSTSGVSGRPPMHFRVRNAGVLREIAGGVR